MTNPDSATSIEDELSKLVSVIERLAKSVEGELARQQENEARQAEDSKKTRAALNALILALLAVGLATPFLWWNDFNRWVQQYAALIPIALAAFAVVSNIAYRAFQSGIVDLDWVMLGALLINGAMAQALLVMPSSTAKEVGAILVFFGLGVVYAWHEAGEKEWQRFKELTGFLLGILRRPVLGLPFIVLVTWDISPSTLGGGTRPWLILLVAVAIGGAGSLLIRVRRRPPTRPSTSPEEEAKWGPVVDQLIDLAPKYLGWRAGKVKRLLLGTPLSRNGIEDAIKAVYDLSPYFGGDAYPNLALAMRNVFVEADQPGQPIQPKGGQRAKVTRT